MEATNDEIAVDSQREQIMWTVLRFKERLSARLGRSLESSSFEFLGRKKMMMATAMNSDEKNMRKIKEQDDHYL